MPYSKGSIPPDHSEFGGGRGLIDPVRRADRVLEPYEQLMEVYATDPYPTVDPETGEITPEGEREMTPETATIGEVPKEA